ncbi:hypothetical protein DHEL01_v212466 [Diaporthe helianthi]|uniref:Uncharacterized protein n=1 Tax=Diaporthe helianthi TaxID=158607 RepID=A0A2P5HFV8_DIAHE|nr:hypothetical protein DHEL01_v212466 [Diaporthe helianthi]
MGLWRRMRNKLKNRSSKKSARPMRYARAGHENPFDDVPRVSTTSSPPRTPPKQALFDEDTMSLFRPSMISYYSRIFGFAGVVPSYVASL